MAAARARFFASLPADELTPTEHALRKALVKAIAASSGPFPIIEWIDRRIGGEVETRQDENGFYEIVERGAGPPVGENHRSDTSKEAFFSKLSPEAFAPPEEALREAVFEFLATWRSPELATLVQLGAYPEVQRRALSFLPRNIPLRDWIEHRIGGEIEFRPGRYPGAEVVYLTESARASVMAKFQQMSGMAPPMGPGMLPMGPPMMPVPPMGVVPAPCAGPPPRGAAAPDKDAWFAGLPGDELLPGEMALREAILNWIQRWPQLRPANRPPGSPPHLADAGSDNDIRRARTELIPKMVKLADWIERRIGGEVELRMAATGNGQQEVYLRGTAPPEVNASARGGTEAKERFFASLPEEEFSPEEDELRAALLEFLERWTGATPPALTEAGAEEEISKLRRAVLPKGCPVSLKEWIDRRIGGEIETRAGPDGKAIFGLRGTLGPAATKRRRSA